MFKLDPDKVYLRKTQSKALIRFQDADPLKHLNNAKYFDYFFNAREDQVAKMYDFRPNETFDNLNAGWVVYTHQIAYIRSAMPGDWVTIISSVIYFNENTVVTEFVMTDESKQELKSVLWTTSKYFNVNTGKTMPHHKEIDLFLKTICAENIDFENITFNSRIKTIKQELREGRFV